MGGRASNPSRHGQDARATGKRWLGAVVFITKSSKFKVQSPIGCALRTMIAPGENFIGLAGGSRPNLAQVRTPVPPDFFIVLGEPRALSYW
jgi:hypothetical protein